ncbi:MAG: DUF3299 domain-containing protein [Ilumatobacter sp.]|nr:DUF3299 domain-containing protein [Ilumatobacter sp.]MDG2040607.1 DUF3299 domain-containing protein [Ilumatobacter sp.]
MTMQPSEQRQRSIRTTLWSALCLLMLAGSACGTNDVDVSTEDAVAVAPSTHETATVASEPEYGDSIADLVTEPESATETANATLPGFRAVEWDDLIQPGYSSDQILERYRDRLEAAEPGSPELDALYEEMSTEYDGASVNPQLDGEDIQLAGFVAPLTFDGDAITEFLLVPYFGACIHVPPPPANQIVKVTLAEGESLSLEESWGAVWVAGKMNVTTTDTDLDTFDGQISVVASYSITEPAFGVYDTV